MELDIKNLISLGIKSLELSKLKDSADLIPGFIESFKKRDQGFLNLPKVKAQVLSVKVWLINFRGNLKILWFWELVEVL